MLLRSFKPPSPSTATRHKTIPSLSIRNQSHLIIHRQPQQQQYLNQNLKLNPFVAFRSFSSSPIQFWKSIGSVKKNRKTRCKLKTHQGAAKRFFVTGRGQFKRAQAGTQHLMTGVRQGRKRRLKPMIIVNKSHANLLRKLLPYVGKRAGFRKLDQSETVWWKSGKLQKTGDALQLAIQRAELLNAVRQKQLTQNHLNRVNRLNNSPPSPSSDSTVSI